MKECSIDTVCHFCLGEEGPLSLGSACGRTSPFCVSSLQFVMRCALQREDSSQAGQSWHWWLGRLNFFEQVIQRFSWDFLIANCVHRPPFAPPSPDPEDSLTSMSLRSIDAQPSSLEFLSDDEGEEGELVESQSGESQTQPSSDGDSTASVDHLLPPAPAFPTPRSHHLPPPHPATETNLLAQVWYFAAEATHVPHHKVGKGARRVIIRIAKVLRSEEFSLELIRDVVSRCHRTQAEGLLERVLAARDKPSTSASEGWRGSHEQQRKKKDRERPDEEKSRSRQPYSPFPEIVNRKANTKTANERSANFAEGRDRASPGGVASGDRRRLSEYGSDDSYRSAVSDLSGDERGDSEKGRGGGGGREGEAQSSSGTSSDSRSEGKSGASGSNTSTLPM